MHASLAFIIISIEEFLVAQKTVASTVSKNFRDQMRVQKETAIDENGTEVYHKYIKFRYEGID